MMNAADVEEAKKAAADAAEEAERAKTALFEAAAVKEAASARTAAIRKQLADLDAAQAAKTGQAPPSFGATAASSQAPSYSRSVPIEAIPPSSIYPQPPPNSTPGSYIYQPNFIRAFGQSPGQR